MTTVSFLTRAFENPAVPQEYRANFTHLFLDIAWFGVLSGSSINFLNVYAARLGATGLQIGLMAAVAATVNLVLAIPAGRWVESRPIGRSMFWTAVVYRIGFLLLIPLPWLFGAEGQILALILIAALMAIPLTALSVGFNVLFAGAVPARWRAYVAGARNVLLSLTFMGSSLGCGYLLHRMPFPQGYQVVFFIGAIGAAMSCLHLYFIRPMPEPAPALSAIAPAGNRPFTETGKLRAVDRAALSGRPASALRLDIWRSPFQRVLLVMLGFHLAQYLAIPLFPLYFVNVLELNDQQIGIGTALFYLAVLLGSMQLRRLSNRLGNKTVTGIGLIGMGAYPFLLGFSSIAWQYYGISFLGGLGWSLAGGAFTNYMLEAIPAHDRPAHFAWYAVVFNGCVLAGSLLGPFIARNAELSLALLVFGVLRVLAGLAILRFG
jgi:MFS family permease